MNVKHFIKRGKMPYNHCMKAWNAVVDGVQVSVKKNEEASRLLVALRKFGATKVASALMGRMQIDTRDFAPMWCGRVFLMFDGDKFTIETDLGSEVVMVGGNIPYLGGKLTVEMYDRVKARYVKEKGELVPVLEKILQDESGESWTKEDKDVLFARTYVLVEGYEIRFAHFIERKNKTLINPLSRA